MPPIEEMDCHQKAVLWRRRTSMPVANDYGDTIVDDPVEINCRWVWTKRVSRAADDSEVTIDASVVVLEEIEEGSLLWLGELADLPGTGTADFPDADLCEVVTEKNTPSIHNRFRRRTVNISRYKKKPVRS